MHGYGDGGGGAPDAELAGEDRHTRPWTSVAGWFEDVDRRALPAYRGELYLETHRGTYTTHRDVKARNAALERALGEAEELAAWCVAVRLPPSAVRPLLDDLRTAWTLVLRNQFHDVLAGSSISAVYDDVHAEYERAERIVSRVIDAARALLPRADLQRGPAPLCEPQPDGSEYVLRNEYLRARLRRDGTLVELAGVEGPNLVALANGLALYRDRPRAWDAWNLDAAYERAPRRIRPGRARVEDGALLVELAAPDTAIVMRVALQTGEPYLRVELAVNWAATHRILRAEHRFAVAARRGALRSTARIAAAQRRAEQRRPSARVRGSGAALGAR